MDKELKLYKTYAAAERLGDNGEACELCSGTGDCHACDGTGIDGGKIGAKSCDLCAGSAVCLECNGSGIGGNPDDDHNLTAP